MAVRHPGFRQRAVQLSPPAEPEGPHDVGFRIAGVERDRLVDQLSGERKIPPPAHFDSAQDEIGRRQGAVQRDRPPSGFLGLGHPFTGGRHAGEDGEAVGMRETRQSGRVLRGPADQRRERVQRLAVVPLEP